MQKFQINRQATGFFSNQQLLLSYNQEELTDLIGLPAIKENFRKQATLKKAFFTPQMRAVLTSVLKKAYEGKEMGTQVEQNLAALADENTFTITTGHQLSVFTGPVFFVYKILHIIRLTEELNADFPELKFVPVFWMASEDHDFEEIRSVDVFNKQLTWESDQKGPVGRFNLEGLGELKAELNAFFQQFPEGEVNNLMQQYSGGNLAEATFNLVHALFKTYGLLIVDGDNRELKREFSPYVQRELEEQLSFAAVEKTNQVLTEKQFKLQVHPREINLFYLKDGFRERIQQKGTVYFIEGAGNFSKEQLLHELNEFPERFSPNVVLRPLYQEIILPNVCYVGGTGEMSYWLQLKGVFDAMQVPYPLIQVRTSILWIDSVTEKKMEKSGLKIADLFTDHNQVKRALIEKFADNELDLTELESQTEVLSKLIREVIEQVDPHLDKFAAAEQVKLQKQLDSVKDKLVKTVKQRHETSLKTIDQVFDRVMPGGTLQERKLNIFSMCPDGAITAKISLLHDEIEPFNPDFMVLAE